MAATCNHASGVWLADGAFESISAGVDGQHRPEIRATVAAVKPGGGRRSHAFRYHARKRWCSVSWTVRATTCAAAGRRPRRRLAVGGTAVLLSVVIVTVDPSEAARPSGLATSTLPSEIPSAESVAFETADPLPMNLYSHDRPPASQASLVGTLSPPTARSAP